MKNIQVIDDAINCSYEIFSIKNSIFSDIFPGENDVEFEDDLFERLGEEKAQKILAELWGNRLDKKTVYGIHGTLFFGFMCEDKKPFYPIKKESKMIANP